MSKVLIIGAGGVGRVVGPKCAPAPGMISRIHDGPRPKNKGAAEPVPLQLAPPMHWSRSPRESGAWV
jgi:lactate dehydrogenase-like 2-hydroxyacid dehydrogenase